MTEVDPWQDYLALPVAPLVLVAQGAALFFVRSRRLRWGLLAAGTAAVAAMFLYVATLPLAPDEGANIGAGVLFLWLLVSVVLLGAGVLRVHDRPRSATPSPARWSKIALGFAVAAMVLPSLLLPLLVALAATTLAWKIDRPSRLRLAATGLTAVALAYTALNLLVV